MDKETKNTVLLLGGISVIAAVFWYLSQRPPQTLYLPTCEEVGVV